MLIRKGFKYRLRMTPEIEQKLAQAAGCCRYVWNRMLAIQKERLDNGRGVQSYHAMTESLPGWKQDKETRWLQGAPSQALQQKLKDLRRAFDDFFDKEQPDKGFPNFKKKHDQNSFRLPQGVKIDHRRVFLPTIGWVRFYKSRDIVGKLKNTTVSRTPDGRWFVSFQTEFTIPDPVHPSITDIGGDFGVHRFFSLSDGSFFEPLGSFRKLEEKLATAQRLLARKVKGSGNWKKQKLVVARIHQKIACAREDFLHKISTTLCKNHALIVIENLRIKNMSASAKGTKDNPGKNVKQKAGLNKAILDQGWGMFRTMLEYKQAQLGGRLLAVPPQYTSRRCPQCGHVHADNRKTQATFRCLLCGFTGHADWVAAVNVLAAGHAVSACGEAA